MHEGFVSTDLGLRGIPAAAEEVMVARDVALAELTGTLVHIAHVSTAGAARLLRDAKARGVPVTGEVTPHHLILTDEALRAYERLRVLLREELGIAPSPTLQAVHRRLLLRSADG